MTVGEHYHCPKCWNDLGENYYEAYKGKCTKCNADLSEYMCQYAKDWGKKKSIDEFFVELDKLIANKEKDKAIEAIDKYFIFGAWGYRTGMDITFVRDLRGIIFASRSK